MSGGWAVAIGMMIVGGQPGATVRVPLNDRFEVGVGELVGAMAKAVGVEVGAAKVPLKLPMTGLGGPISRSLLAETVGADLAIVVEGRELAIGIPAGRLGPGARDDWTKRLNGLLDRVEAEAKRRADYGMHALKSYRPDDPTRPTVCLIHGLNSTSSVFWHMIAPIEAAGYGVVVYDFPYNRDLDESAEVFRRDWTAFRKKWGETRGWGVVAHSMGGLLARGYVEDDAAYRGDVASMILIAPVNRGSNLSKAQTLLQMLQGLRAVNGEAEGRRADPLAHLGDGLGAAADDMTPGSPFLTVLNARPRRAGLPYHTIAGDGAFLSAVARKQIDARLGLDGRPALFGGLVRVAATNLPAQLDEITEGTGDGCVSVAATRLDGVADHLVIHANHLELIRAPLLYPDPGPVVSMPHILRWLAKDLPAVP